MKNYIYLFLIIIFNSSASILLKLAAKNTIYNPSRFVFSILLEWRLISGIILYGLAFILYARSLNYFNLNYVQPITTSATIVMVAIASKLIFSENITALNFIGIILIICGVILSTIGN
jgi:small multidrug resistance pump